MRGVAVKAWEPKRGQKHDLPSLLGRLVTGLLGCKRDSQCQMR
jgi:hypothetical protein